MQIKFTGLLFLVLLSYIAFGQLKVGAGRDTVYCDGSFGSDSPKIGDNLSVLGGLEPYSYVVYYL